MVSCSPGTAANRPPRQSAFACSIRSSEEEQFEERMLPNYIERLGYR